MRDQNNFNKVCPTGNIMIDSYLQEENDSEIDWEGYYTDLYED